MSDVDRHEPGTFCWCELATTDALAAKKFYTELMGWSVADRPIGPDMVYSMLQVRGRNVAALYGMGRDDRLRGVPAHWLCYVSVADADESVARARALGAEVIHDAGDVMDAGRMAVLRDPTGAVLALWQPRRTAGAAVAGELGTAAWMELYTDDPDRARGFYTSLFGWTTKTSETGGGPYTVFSNGGTQVAGMMRIADDWVGMPPTWMVYFMVDDCDRAVAATKRAGGTVDAGPMDVPGVGRFATVRDPQGAGFAVITMAMDG